MGYCTLSHLANCPPRAAARKLSPSDSEMCPATSTIGRNTVAGYTWLSWLGLVPQVPRADFASSPGVKKCSRQAARFTIPRRPLRFDFDHSHFAQRIVAKTTPFPISTFLHQPALHRISVNIAQLPVELGLIPNIAVRVALLPEWALRFAG